MRNEKIVKRARSRSIRTGNKTSAISRLVPARDLSEVSVLYGYRMGCLYPVRVARIKDIQANSILTNDEIFALVQFNV